MTSQDKANTWKYGGELACSLTSMVPPGDLDPLAAELCNEMEGRPADGVGGPWATARLVRAFCHGHLPSQTLNLLRRQRAFINCEPADFVMHTGGRAGRRPVHDLSKAWIVRVAALFLGKPGGDSWEDEDRDFRFPQVALEGVSKAALQQAWKLGLVIASAETEAHECRRQHVAGMEQKHELLDHLGGERLGGMTDVEKVKLTEKQEPLTAAKLPRWFWDDHDDPDTLRAWKFFFILSWHELPEDFLELVRQVITHKGLSEAGVNHHSLFILALNTVSGDDVSRSHLEEAWVGIKKVCEEDVAMVERMLVEAGGEARKGRAAAFRVTHISEKDVLKFQRRLVVIRASPRVLEVYRLSY
ncbi:unnamed protein product [Symbiodinium sp. CCMP2456]|nr:unnamed protein product [Symbiodinium sp. CCMP2456]